MKDWPLRSETEAEIARADDLLDKADALLRRHRDTGPEPVVTESDPILPLADGDDLPILTDIVDEFDADIPVLTDAAPPVATSPPPATIPAAAAHGIDPAIVAEHLIEIDTEISREVEAWLANELPQILSRELDALVEKVRRETLAHLRATLLPTLSERIARRLNALDD